MITESLTYLRESEDVFKTVLIGGLLVLFGVFIVPTITLVGYLMRVLRRTSGGDDVAPTIEVDELVEMTKEGIPGFVVAFVYGIVPGIVAVVLFGGAIFAFILGGSADSSGLVGLGFGGLLLAGLVSIVLSLAAAYVIPAALANVAEKGTIGAGFDVGVLRQVLFSGTYATGWAMGLVVVILGAIVLSVLSAVTFGIGGVLGVFVQFYTIVAAYYIIGQTWEELRIDETMDDSEPVEQAAV